MVHPLHSRNYSSFTFLWKEKANEKMQLKENVFSGYFSSEKGIGGLLQSKNINTNYWSLLYSHSALDCTGNINQFEVNWYLFSYYQPGHGETPHYGRVFHRIIAATSNLWCFCLPPRHRFYPGHVSHLSNVVVEHGSVSSGQSLIILLDKYYHNFFTAHSCKTCEFRSWLFVKCPKQITKMNL